MPVDFGQLDWSDVQNRLTYKLPTGELSSLDQSVRTTDGETYTQGEAVSPPVKTAGWVVTSGGFSNMIGLPKLCWFCEKVNFVSERPQMNYDFLN